MSNATIIATHIRRYRLRGILTLGLSIIAFILLIEFLFTWKAFSHLALYGEVFDRELTSDKKTMESDFQWTENCVSDEIKVYIYPNLEGVKYLQAKTFGHRIGESYNNILSAIRQSKFYTNDIQKACLFVAPFETLCESNNVCIPGGPFMTHMLHTLPRWSHGKNHLVFEISHMDHAPFDGEKAILVRSSTSRKFFNERFDIPITLVSLNFDINRAIISDGSKPVNQRKINISFKGSISTKKEIRKELLSLHDGSNNIILIRCEEKIKGLDCDDLEKQYHNSASFENLLIDSKFGIAIRGSGLHSYRLAETMVAGAIPIIIGDNYVLPFEEVLPWNIFSVKILEKDIRRIGEIVSRIDPLQLERMQTISRCIAKEYLISWNATVLAVLNLMQWRIDQFHGRLNNQYWTKCT